MTDEPSADISPQLFGPFDGRVWLNAAHQGPLFRAAAETARKMIDQKLAPGRIPDESFFELPERLRATIGRLIGAPPEEVILANSTSYGLNLLVQGLGLRAGEEVLLVDGDFPATITPWLILESEGVRIRRVTIDRRPLSPDQVAREISSTTRVLCSSWVFSYTGEAIDASAIGKPAASARSHSFSTVPRQSVRVRSTSRHSAPTRWSAAASNGCAAPTPPGSAG